MKAFTRRDKIKELIDIHGGVEVANLSTLFNVSMETIRRDLEVLSEENYIKKIHGGAVKKVISNTDYFFNAGIAHNLSEKKKIAELASSFIEDGDVIALATGTTVLQLVDYIYTKDIFIVTNSFPVITNLSKYDISHLKGKIMFLGGEFNENSLSCYGETCISAIKNLNITKSFISCDSFDTKNGISFHNLREGILTKEFISNSKDSYLLIDSNKFSSNSFYNIGTTSIINNVISSIPCPDNLKDISPNTNWFYS